MLFDVVKIITKIGKTEAGISTYCISLQYILNIFVSMMLQFPPLQFIDSSMCDNAINENIKNSNLSL